MKNNSEYIKFSLIGFVLILAVYFFPRVIPYRISSGINDLSSWYIYTLSRKFIKPLKIIGIAIDDDSLNRIPQRWPWKRSLYARIIRILDQEKVNTIGIDFAFVGEAEDKEDDSGLQEALNNVSAKVVLAYFFDYKKALPVFPLAGLKESAYLLGMVNTPQDQDGKTRRLRGYVELGGNFYYSFSVALSAAFLNQSPQDLLSSLPFLKDRTFFVQYLLKPKDIIRISFSDVLENLEELKQKYGRGFLNDALVLIYPEAEIFHDTYLTPLGKMSGGLLHLNGSADILLKRFTKQVDILSFPFFILSLAAISYILSNTGFLLGFIFTWGVISLNFWFSVLLNFKGIKFDYSRILLFCLLFFILGSLYKYAFFLAQLLKIKHKATFDPLRNLFTLRYFYYRLELERRKIYFRKDLFLIFIYLESFKAATEGMSLEQVKNIWQDISSGLISLRGKSFWSVYSAEEIVGYMISPPSTINSLAHFLKNNLGALLSEKDIKSRVKLGYARLKKGYSVREAVFLLSSGLKNKEEDVVLFKDNDLGEALYPAELKIQETAKLMDSLGEDIEEKDRQLLSLIDNLNKEHAKTKEAFFQIITSLVNALEARDPYSQGHSERVCGYVLMMAERLGCNKEQKEKLKKAALLHDIGKIGIPDSVLHKKEKLNDEEWDFIKKHEIIAVKILEPLKDIDEILPWIMYHHERWDGKGYPHGLAGEAIPEASQLIALADVYDALTTGRDYKIAFSRDEAIKEIIRNKGTQFNPKLTDIFVEVITQKQK